RHGASAIAGDGEAGGAGQGQNAVGGRQGDLDAGAAGVDIGHGDGIAVGGGEHQGAILIHSLSGRHGVDRGVVHRVDGDGDVIGVAESAAGAGVALVVGDDLDVGSAVVVAGGREDQAVHRIVDVGQVAGQRHGAGAVAGDGEAGGAGVQTCA